MSENPTTLIEAASRFSRQSNAALKETLLTQPRIPHDGGGGGGEDDKMEKRVTELERTYLQVAMDLSYIKGKVDDMPTKDFITTRLIAVVGGFSAMIGLVVIIMKLVSP